jgi:hypothetical protein
MRRHRGTRFGEVVRFLRLRQAIGLVVICLSVAAADNVAFAFSDPLEFAKPAAAGGGEGRWFTGAPSDGYGCGVCHTPNKAEKLVVEGLPKDGYVPDTEYQIRVAWPVTAARTDALYNQPPPARLPRTSLVAEFIAETAGDSGSVHGGWPDPGSKFTPGSLSMSAPAELCHMGPYMMSKRFGYTLFQQDVDRDPFKDPPAVSACSGANLTRCLIAVRGCGSKELRLTWRSPSEIQGAIWFSGSFVTTDQVSASPDGDAVSEFSIPIAPAGSRGYEAELGQKCTLVAGLGAKHSQPGLFASVGAALGLLILRRRYTRRTRGRT